MPLEKYQLGKSLRFWQLTGKPITTFIILLISIYLVEVKWKVLWEQVLEWVHLIMV